MKTKLTHLRWLAVVLLVIMGTAGVMAQGPYPNSGDHSVCLGDGEPYGVNFTENSSYTWSILPLTGGDGVITNGATPNLINILWNSVGTCTLQLEEETNNGCAVVVSITITVNPTAILVINDPAPVCSPSTVDITAPAVTAGSTLNGATLTYWEDALGTIPLTNPSAVAVSGTYYIQAGTAAGCSVISPVVVIVNPSPELVITNPAAVCQPATVDITAAAITVGSTLNGATLTYWTDAAGTIALTNPDAIAVSGTYYIKAETTGGCSVILPVVVEVNETPLLVIIDPLPVCSPSTVDITAPAVTAGSTLNGATLTYWEDALGTIPLTNPTAVAVSGTYYIQAGTAAGCSVISPVVVIVNPSPELVITNPAAVCQPATVDITAAAITVGSTLNGATLTYWTDAAGTIALTNPDAIAVSGTYYIKAETTGGCSVILPVVVEVNETPLLVINDPAPVCSPLTVDITAPAVTAGSTLNGATLTYWEDALGTIPLTNPTTVAVSGTYYIQAGTAAGCSVISPVVVIVNPSPELVITNPAAVCQPATVDITAAAITVGSTLNGATLTYWTDAAGTIALTNPDAIAVSGTYYIKAETTGGCSVILPVVVEVNETPLLVIIDPLPVCSPSTVDITAPAVTAGSTLNGATLTYWEDALGTIPLTNPSAVAVSGTYYIQAGTAAGCSVILPVVVVVNPSPELVITDPAAVCQPATVDITAPAITAGSTLNGATLTYWTDAAGTIALTNPDAIAVSGTYYIKAETTEGCSVIEPVVVIINPTPTPEIIGANPVCQYDIEAYSVEENAGNSYTWVVVGGTINSGQGTHQIFVTWTTPTAGSVEVTETAGTCSDTDTMIITINAAPTTTIIYHN